MDLCSPQRDYYISAPSSAFPIYSRAGAVCSCLCCQVQLTSLEVSRNSAGSRVLSFVAP